MGSGAKGALLPRVCLVISNRFGKADEYLYPQEVSQEPVVGLTRSRWRSFCKADLFIYLYKKAIYGGR